MLADTSGTGSEEFGIATLQGTYQGNYEFDFDAVATDQDGDSVDTNFEVAFDADGVVQGDNFSEVIAGGSGADTLLGGGGDDIIYGNDGADIIEGGPGDDILVGDIVDIQPDGSTPNIIEDGDVDVIDGGTVAGVDDGSAGDVAIDDEGPDDDPAESVDDATELVEGVGDPDPIDLLIPDGDTIV